MSDTQRRILLVEDEESLAESIRYSLEQDGYAVTMAFDGRKAIERFHSDDPDLVILDLMLPELSGLDVCRLIRKESNVPIVMVTAKDSEADKVAGLELGADDYVTKPFNPRALVARVKAILRRTDATARRGRPIEVGALRIDPRRREATVNGRDLGLRAREFDLLAALARDPGVVLTRDMLLENVWGTDFPGETRTVDVHVGEVRRKLGSDGPTIETVRGIGYRLVPPRREPVPDAARDGAHSSAD